MRIKKIDIPKTPDDNDGLESIKMDKLGSVVLIAGKNGSGKTRILNKIFDRFSSKPQKSKLAELRTNNQRLYSSATKVCQVKISQLKVKLSIQRDTNQREKIQEEIEKAKHSLTITENRLRNDEQTWKYIETDIQSDDYTFVPFVPKSLNLQDCNKFSKNEILSSATSIDSVGINSLPEGAFAKIQVIQNRRFNVTHLETEVTDEEKKQAIADYDKLQNIIKIFLNTKIGRTIDDEATLFGFPMGQSNLSDGQKILLQFCLAIYSQEQALKDLILVLDEPENHLHPSIIIETIKKIQDCVTDGQIWIATHSIPLLAHFDPSSIWFVENSKIEHAGKTPEKVLRSLLGNEDEVGKLQDFIGLPSQYAASRYAFECLCPPKAIQTDSNDPQSFQIREDLLSLSKTGKLRILDYGAGKGRIISNIVDLETNDQEKLIQSIECLSSPNYPPNGALMTQGAAV